MNASAARPTPPPRWHGMSSCVAKRGDADGWRAGLAVLQTRGVAAWLGAWRGVCAPPRPPTPARTDIGSAAPPEAADRLVAALASMALGALARG